MYILLFTSIYNYIPLMKFVLWGRHEQVKERNQSPCVARQQPVPETLLHFLYILDTPNNVIIIVQQRVSGSIQLLHHLCHPAVMALSTMSIGQLTVRTPARCARPRRAKTVDSHLSSIHAEGIQVGTHKSYLSIVYISMY